MGVRRIHHVAIAVRSIDETLKLLGELFDLKAERIEEVPDQGVKAALIPIGDAELELLEPTDPSGGVAKFLEKRGEGIHHICFEVEDVDRELERLAAKGVELIDKKGRKGLAGKIGFIHPRSVKGVLVELAQKAEE